MEEKQTVIHTQDSSGGAGFFLGILALIIFLLFMMFYGIPMIRSSIGGPQLNVPSDMNINIREQK